MESIAERYDVEASEEGLLEYACRRGLLHYLLEEYIVFCSGDKEKQDDSAKKRDKRAERGRRFPNVAGFCRYFGIGEAEYAYLSAKYPEEFQRISAVFEDEALNSDVSPTILSAYLKKRLGYEKNSGSEVCEGQLRVIFDHDVMEDGI